MSSKDDHAVEINNHCAKLCEDIKAFYLKIYSRCEDTENWFMLCEAVMKYFIIDRTGWREIDQIKGTYVFLDKHSITVSLLKSGSPGMLLVHTATGIAQAELVDKYISSEDGELEDFIMKISKCMEGQDWLLPRVRRKSV